MKHILILLVVLLTVLTPVHAVVLVTNVVVVQREGTKLVDIAYDVSSDVADTVAVTVVASNEAGAVDLGTLSGDIGSRISTGGGKRILWDGGADWNGNVTTGLCVTISAEDEDMYPVKRLFRYSFTLTNQKGEFVPKVEFWVRAPVRQTAHQRLYSLETSYPCEEIDDAHGNKTLYFCFNNYGPYQVTIVRVEVYVNMSSDSIEIPSNPSSYLAAADYIEINDPAFLSLAPTFSPASADQMAYDIMNWVYGHVADLGYVATPHGALYALQQRQGDGTEMMYLFVALCRLNGIPARPMMGYVCGGNAILSPSGSENWAEYFDGERWQLVDTHDRVFKTLGDQYVALSVAVDDGPLVYSQRYRVSGDGLTAKMN